jgi:sulfate permease, SulP family
MRQMRINAKEILSGAITAVIILSSTLGYVAFIFSGTLAGTLHLAVGFGLIGAGLMAIIFALGSSAPFAIAGPDSKPTAVLAIVAALMAAQLSRSNPPVEPGLIVLAVLVVGTLTTGVVLYLLGATKMGKWIRFVPFPVVGGFMAASGALLGLGGIGILAGVHLSWTELGGLAGSHHLPQILAGVGFAAALWFGQRFRHPLTFPCLLAGAIVVVHAIRLADGYSIDAAREAGWLLNVGRSSSVASPLALFQAARAVDLHGAALAGGEFIGLFAVTAITLLLGLVVVEVESRRDIDLDRELRLNGLANIVVGLAGGMVGTLSVSRTLFNFRTGGSSRVSGLVAGALCLGVLGLGTDVLVYFPVPVLGGLLVAQGAQMLHEWLIRTRKSMPLPDYLQIIVIMLAIIRWDFLAGVAVGVVSACVTFAINTSRVRLVKQVVDRSSYRSRVDRPIGHQEILAKYGTSIPIMWLHGFVFFGSAHRLLLDVKQIVETRSHHRCHSLILDWRQVLGIDSSAILNLGKLWNFAEREGFAIALSSVPSDVEKALRIGGLLGPKDKVARLFADLDAALEWCEDRLIAGNISNEAALRSADEWLAREIGNPELFVRLVSYLEQLEFKAGDYVFSQGDKGDALFLIYTGRVSVLLQTSNGPELRLRSMAGQTVLGEMGLYRTQPRGASVRVDEACVVYRLSADALSVMEADDPALAYAFHKFIVRILAARLEYANREAAALQN